jgi:hypothetical protein
MEIDYWPGRLSITVWQWLIGLMSQNRSSTATYFSDEGRTLVMFILAKILINVAYDGSWLQNRYEGFLFM